jgi:alpha-glucosidase (family GH31 glycosyl hydrolase)
MDKSIVVVDRARFTFVTERIVRMEYDRDAAFIDEPTLAVAARPPSAVHVKTERTGGGAVVMRTKTLTVSYTPKGSGFSPDDLSVSFTMSGRTVSWTPGTPDDGNLGGTYRTLDNCDGDDQYWWEPVPGGGGRWDIVKTPKKLVLENGLISRDGWSVYDDSGKPIVVNGWVSSRRASHVSDLYFFAFGHDYKAAVREASLVFGKQPLPPRYTLGYWYSRYWAYTDQELIDLTDQCDRMSLPLDILVVDMDWHQLGWTGYTWDREYFPDPKAFLSEVRQRGLKVCLNLHPAEGVSPAEEAYGKMAKALGKDAKKQETIPFDCTAPAFMKAYFELLHHPKEDIGVDFWWMDWQQGEKTAVENLDPLTWLNKLHWDDLESRRTGLRSLIFSRFGGAGAGRYPVGFSGDTFSRWASLAYQPYFTATAANILYGYWSHDIGGHMPGETEPELYTRWIQFGVYSPILRTHTTKNPKAVRLPWLFAAPYSELMMSAIRARYRMVPYVYTENRAAYDTGLSLVRPMFYDWPEEKAAYEAKGQYQFGSQMIVAPVTEPVDPETLSADKPVWLPEGDFIDTAHGELVPGGRTVTRSYLLSEVPVFVRPGAIVVGQGPVRRLLPGSYRDLVVTVYPSDRGSYRLYEDDGISNDYASGRCVFVPIAMETKKGTMTITVGPAEGSYRGFSKKRSLTLELPMTAPPRKVEAGQKTIAWRYAGAALETIVVIDAFDVTHGITVKVTLHPKMGVRELSGLKGLFARLDTVRSLTTSASTGHPIHPEERLAVRAAQTPRRIELTPATARAELDRLRETLARLPAVMKDYLVAHAKSHQYDAHREKTLMRAEHLLGLALAQFPAFSKR